jgi:hypothetical protein
MNHFQDGKTVGEGNVELNFGLGTGLAYNTDTTEIDPQNYEVRTERGPVSVFLSGMIRAGVTSNFDLGGELFTSFGSTGFKFFGKYALTDSLSPLGIALMPIIGFSFPWFEEDEDQYQTFDEGEARYVVRSFLMEFLIPISYHTSERFAITWGPKLYFHHNYLLQSGDEDVEFHRKGRQTYTSPGAFLGFHIDNVRIEANIIYFNKQYWTPYFGFSYSPKGIM